MHHGYQRGRNNWLGLRVPNRIQLLGVSFGCHAVSYATCGFAGGKCAKEFGFDMLGRLGVCRVFPGCGFPLTGHQSQISGDASKSTIAPGEVFLRAAVLLGGWGGQGLTIHKC